MNRGEDEKILTSFDGKLVDSAETLCAYLEKTEAVNAKAELLANYCMRRADVDTRDATYQAMVGKFMSVVVGLSAATSFETPELMAIADDVYKTHAICVHCGDLAYVSHRTVSSDKRVLLGETESYEPLCRACYEKALAAEESAK